MSPTAIPGNLLLKNGMVITGEQKNNWTPAEIDTALWLDAADISTITQSGGSVSQWNDKSGNGRNAVQLSATNQPLYDATAFNSNPTLVFDGSDYMETPSFASSSNYTIVAVVTLLVATSYPMIYTFKSAAGSVDLRGVDSTGKPSLANISNNDGPGVQTPPATPVTTTDNMVNTTNIIIGKITNGIGTLRQNGSLRATKSVIFTSPTSARQVGARSNSFYWNGRISEIIELGNVSVSDEERIEGYLAHKWGLTANLPSDHPYKLVGPTP